METFLTQAAERMGACLHSSFRARQEESALLYRPLVRDLMRRGAHKYQLSCWLVNVAIMAAEVHDHYRRFLQENDRLMVRVDPQPQARPQRHEQLDRSKSALPITVTKSPKPLPISRNLPLASA